MTKSLAAPVNSEIWFFYHAKKFPRKFTFTIVFTKNTPSEVRLGDKNIWWLNRTIYSPCSLFSLYPGNPFDFVTFMQSRHYYYLHSPFPLFPSSICILICIIIVIFWVKGVWGGGAKSKKITVFISISLKIMNKLSQYFLYALFY